MLYCGYGNFTGEEDDLMQDRKLEQALEIYFQENPDRESDKYQEIQKYLKLRIRSVMELLIENEDTERMEQIEKCGWFSANELENFIRCAQGAPSVCVSSPTPWTTPGTAAAPSP